MKLLSTLLIVIALCFTPSFAKGSSNSYKSSANYSASKSSSKKSSSDVSVKGYTKKNGTQVSAYKRTSQNGTQKDNFSSKGNINPYTGKVGTKTSYK